jgi:molybdenum cofactor cytidylyltransferase
MAGCAILLPAAGASSRMRGSDKLLEEVSGQTLLHLIAARACQVSGHVAVTLPATDTARRAALGKLPLRMLNVADPSEGMAASLRAGASWALQGGCTALMVVLPDMPDITAEDMRALMNAQARMPDQPLRAATVGRHAGHPVILPRNLWGAMASLRGDTGMQQIFGTSKAPRQFALPGARATCDLDTPEDWARWRGDGRA